MSLQSFKAKAYYILFLWFGYIAYRTAGDGRGFWKNVKEDWAEFNKHIKGQE